MRVLQLLPWPVVLVATTSALTRVPMEKSRRVKSLEQSQQECAQATAARHTRRQQQSQEKQDQHLQIRQRLSRQQHSAEQRCQQLQARRTRHKSVEKFLTDLKASLVV
jgi:signal recognition particle GTPase